MGKIMRYICICHHFTTLTSHVVEPGLPEYFGLNTRRLKVRAKLTWYFILKIVYIHKPLIYLISLFPGNPTRRTQMIKCRTLQGKILVASRGFQDNLDLHFYVCLMWLVKTRPHWKQCVMMVKKRGPLRHSYPTGGTQSMILFCDKC